MQRYKASYEDKIEVETWKDVEGYEDYMVSNEGTVKSYKKNQTHGTVLKPILLREFYKVNLYNSFRMKQAQIHRLVAMAFIPNPENLDCVRHRDKNKLNNTVRNLYWCRPNSTAQAKSYKFLNPEGKLVKIFNLNKFCTENNLTSTAMVQVHLNKANQHKQWTKYKEVQ